MVTILFTMLKEVFLALVAKVAFKTVLERFSTRLVIYGLEKLKGYSTNEVVDETVQDVINQLKGKGLKVVDELGD
jgi:hypothetical protein